MALHSPQIREAYKHPSAMEPLLPQDACSLEEQAYELSKNSAALERVMHYSAECM